MPRPPAGDDISEDELNQVRELLAEVQGGKSAITFRDVGGMDAVKERVRLDMILPFQKPELYAKFGRKAGGGLLLYGPPGCGKTLLARATAGECGAFFSSVSIPEILSKWMGESEQHLHQIFEVARRKAPSILFFDEIDALGVKRSEAGSSMATLVNVFLTEVDGASADNTNVFVLAATNMPWRIDSAFRRPGRFDRVVFVPPPDETARRSILDLHLEGLPHRGVDSEKLAKRTERFSGADLKALVNAASEQALMRELNSGVSANLTQDDLDNARKTLKPSTLEWLETAANYASYANAAGLYDDLAEYLKK